jgi:pimeloyl-ACP methyl ester carboxylesterase
VRAVSDLHVAAWGDAGQPALLVHGSFGWGEETWREQRPLAKGYRLLVVDRRGFGNSPEPDERVDFERDADDVTALLDESMHLVGHSYGGVVSLLAAARVPERVRSLCVIEPPALGVVRGDRDVDEFVRRVTAAAEDASSPEEYAARFLAAFGFPPPRGRPTRKARRAAESSWRERPPEEAQIPLDELAAAHFPKLVVRGAWDLAPPDARARGARIFRRICELLVARLDAEEAVFPAAAHNPQHLREPFNERLRAFWESAPQGRTSV